MKICRSGSKPVTCCYGIRSLRTNLRKWGTHSPLRGPFCCCFRSAIWWAEFHPFGAVWNTSADKAKQLCNEPQRYATQTINSPAQHTPRAHVDNTSLPSPFRRICVLNSHDGVVALHRSRRVLIKGGFNSGQRERLDV